MHEISELTGALFLFKVFIAIVTILFLFCFGFLAGSHGVLAVWPGIKPAHPALKGEILTNAQQL